MCSALQAWLQRSSLRRVGSNAYLCRDSNKRKQGIEVFRAGVKQLTDSGQAQGRGFCGVKTAHSSLTRLQRAAREQGKGRRLPGSCGSPTCGHQRRQQHIDLCSA